MDKKTESEKQKEPPTTDSFVKTDMASKSVPETSDLKEWPGAFGIYKISRKAVLLNLGPLIGIALSIIGASIVYGIVEAIIKHSPFSFLVELVYELFNIVLGSALIYATIKSVKGQKVDIGEAFSAVFSDSVNIILGTLLMLLVSLLSVLLFIIPAFFIIPRIYLTVYFVIDKKMKPVEAFEASWHHTKGNVGKVYGIIGVNILILLPIVTIIGIVVSIYFGLMYYAASAVLFVFLTNKKHSVAAEIEN